MSLPPETKLPECHFLPGHNLDLLFEALRAQNYTSIVGPRVEDGVIRFTPLTSSDELPWGIAEEQGPGHYRLSTGPAERAFSWTTSAQAAKPLSFPAHETLWSVERNSDGRLAFQEQSLKVTPTAVIGVRGCDLAALELHDKHFLNADRFVDPWYQARRASLFLVAVNCARSAATCFCASTGDGPAAKNGYDLLLDELDSGYLLTSGSNSGSTVLAQLRLEPANTEQLAAADKQLQAAAKAQTRSLPSQNLAAELVQRRSSNAWQQVAETCLACGNCTAVCPSCFCHRHTEAPALDATASYHGREWDSCFSESHSFLHGRPHRSNIAQRYRQWLSHKFGSWHAQYDRSGCTGCGRCITWCPVGIDITASVTMLLAEESA